MVNKKGWSEALILMIVIGIISIIFFAGWIYVSNELRTVLDDTSLDTDTVNISDATQKTYNYLDDGLRNGLPLISLALIVGFAIATLLMAYFSTEHPALIMVYIMLIVGLFILGVYVSNTYETLLSNDVLGTTLNTFTAANFIVLHLPLWITVIGFFGIVLMIGGRYLL